MKNLLLFLLFTISIYAQSIKDDSLQFKITVEGQLGHEYFYGYSLKSKTIPNYNPRKGISLLKKAVLKNDVLAMFDLYEIYKKGIYGEEVNKKEAKNLLRNSISGIESLANKKNIRAMFYLGEIYKNGLDNYKIDISKAFNLHKEVAKKENPLGWFSLASYHKAMYEYHGRNINHNKKALELYEKAINKGLKIAAREAGIMYHIGDFGLESNIDKAKKYFKKAEGEYISLTYLGHVYHIEKNKKKALEYYKKASQNGAPHSYYYLARNAQTLEIAKKYLNEAKKRGAKEADEYLYFLESKYKNRK